MGKGSSIRKIFVIYRRNRPTLRFKTQQSTSFTGPVFKLSRFLRGTFYSFILWKYRSDRSLFSGSPLMFTARGERERIEMSCK